MGDFKLNIVFSSGHLIALSFLFIIFDLSTAVSLGLAFFGAYLLMDYFMMVSSSFLDEDLLDSWGVFLSVLLIYLAGLFFIGATFVFISFVKKRFNEKNIKFFWVIYSVLLFLSGFIILSFKIDNYTHSYMYMLLFFTLFPLINAPLDWLSLGVTRGLLQAVRVGRYSGRWILTWAVVDLLMALFFLFLITALFIGVTVLGNVITGQKLVSIGCILHELWGSPEKVDHWWIYFMLLSTLVPTLIHFALAGGAVTLWLPRQWRLQLADGLERDIHKTFLAWTYLTFMPVIGFLLVPGALLYFLWWLLNMHGGWLGMRLLDWAEMLAHFANPAMQ